MNTSNQTKTDRIRIGPRQAMALLLPYMRDRLLAQVRSVWLIVVYLIFFQTMILGIAIYEASLIAVGIGMVVVGLAFFMEGLFLGLMRLGSLVGSGLPRKSPMLVVLGFALLLGFLATLAEPSIQVLQMAGKSVKPWEAPLLFMLLNTFPHYLIYAVGSGVGVAVSLGMIRFYYNLSLKPFIYIFVGALTVVTAWAGLDPKLAVILGLAWDCGAVTTGPVTVPLVLALGIGISRMVGSSESGTTGFGVVTLASLLPIIAVLLLGVFLNRSVPDPMSEADFFSPQNRSAVEVLFKNADELEQYRSTAAAPQPQSGLHQETGPDPAPHPDHHPAAGSADADDRRSAIQSLIVSNMIAAVKAIGLLVIPILLALFLLVREKVPYPDEIALGIVFCVLGLAIFSIGIELGLDKLGSQVGSKLPSSFKPIPIMEQKKMIADFDPGLVQSAVTASGERYQFFYIEKKGKITAIPYDPANFDHQSRVYRYIPVEGPLFGSGSPLPGMLVVILFAFIMGYGATLAEPALNALGMTVEKVTAGTFKKSLLMQAVAVGVGTGIALGITKIILSIPLTWILLPSYILLLVVTRFSSEDFVNIGWDSAGVTTGPITVPLVLTLGLGLGSQVGVVEGFGILASASVFPILSVLLLGLYINRKRKASLADESRK